MPHSIDIDDDVLEILKRNAEPFVDTHNSVLRRLLGVDRVKRQFKRAAGTDVGEEERTMRGALLPEREYEAPILRYLDECGGRAPSREVIKAVGKALADDLTELDKRSVRSGGVRWEKRAAFVRLRLVERGELVRDSPRGTWEISDKGRQRLQSQ
jgi:hypothetical protein